MNMNSKKLVSFLLAFLVFSTQIGYALNIHYCGDRIAEISLAHFSANCGMESQKNSEEPLKKEFSKKSCCKDDLILFQNYEYQKEDLEGFSKLIDFKAVIQLSLYNYDYKTLFFSKVFSNWNPPPPKFDKLFLSHKSFIFYG